jgi:UDP-N-acetylmuramoylalanine--D-glutamate ligase
MTTPSARREGFFAGKTVHVIGLGEYGTGRATARALWNRGARVTVSDIKPACELAGEVEGLKDTEVMVQTGADAYRGIEDAQIVVPSPGVPLDIPPLERARAAGAEVISDIEVAYLIARSPIVAVTGTKGKTTTTTLIGRLLTDAGRLALVGGNIGKPLVALAEEAGSEAVLVAEVSSFQLEATRRFRPRVAVLLNLFADHLDRHGDLTAYREAKARVFANQQAGDAAVIARDDEEAWRLRGRTRVRVWPFSLKELQPDGADVAEGWLRVLGQPVCPASSVRLLGKHNLGNVLAALAAAAALGAPLSHAAATVAAFAGVEHRLEMVGSVGGVAFVNDSQATTPGAAIAGLEAFDERVTLIAGGRPKVHDFRELAAVMASRGVSLVAIGEAAEEIVEAARGAGVGRIARAEGLPAAVKAAYRWSQAGDVVLLSPACASFDMFHDMAERGRVFKATVQQLKQTEEQQACQPWE